MIRYLSIECKLNQLIKSDFDVFLTAIMAYTLSSLICPICGAKGCCKNHMSYNRWIVTVEENEPKTDRVGIPCVLCDSCNHLHAILPDILIPYSPYSLRFILHVLEEYLKRTCTVAELCYQWGIAISTLYSWKHRFLEHSNLWVGQLGKWACFILNVLEHMRKVDSLPSCFFENFKFSFMQYKNTTQYRNSS